MGDRGPCLWTRDCGLYWSSSLSVAFRLWLQRLSIAWLAKNHRFRFLAWPRHTRFGFLTLLRTIGSVRSSSVCHAQQHCFRHSATCPDVIDRETGRETTDSQNRHLHDHQRGSWAVLHANDQRCLCQSDFRTRRNLGPRDGPLWNAIQRGTRRWLNLYGLSVGFHGLALAKPHRRDSLPGVVAQCPNHQTMP